MSEQKTMLDVFCHVLPAEYSRATSRLSHGADHMFERARVNPAMCDLSVRFGVMDQFPGYRQIISLTSPPLETLVKPAEAVELARLANDEMATLVATHPTRFAGFVATLPLATPAAAAQEALRAMEQLGATGVQFFTNIGGRPLDCPDLLELLDLCAERRYPIWLHPTRGIETPDYASEELSQLELWWLIGWPLETALAMVRLAYTGYFDRWPEQVIIAHHAGGVLPMVAGRIENGGAPGGRTPAALRSTCNPASREPLAEALRHFHVDSATFGSRAAIACGLDFFGPSHMMFATDMPFGPQQGMQIIAKTLNAISQLRLTGSERQAILAGNATRLLSRSSSALTSS